MRPRQLRRYRAANSRVKIIIAARLRVVVFGARLIADDVVWWRRRANQSLDASRASGLLSDNLRLTQLRAAASTPPLCLAAFENLADGLPFQRLVEVANIARDE